MASRLSLGGWNPGREETSRVEEVNLEEGKISPDFRRTCVILLDFQNEFAKPGGKLHDSVADTIRGNGMLEKVPKLVEVARNKGSLILHSPVIMKTGDRFQVTKDFDPHSYAAMDGLFQEGTWNSQFVDELQPKMGEEILWGRNDFSAFEGTELQSILKRHKIETVILCGFLSNVCIECTAGAAKQQIPGLKVVVCSDGCAAKTQQEHETTMSNTLPLLDIQVMKCFEVEEMIRTETKPLPHLASPDAINGENRPRILALHGAQSNEWVAKLQLENLGITVENTDIVYLQGVVEVEEGSPDITSIFAGPYFSWYDKSNSKETIIESVRKILRAVEEQGPFDGVYGFSSGAAMAVLASCITADPQLQAIIQPTNEGNFNNRGIEELIRRVPNSSLMQRQQSTLKRRKSTRENKRQSFGYNRRSMMPNLFPSSIESGDIIEPPFKFAIFACTTTLFEDVTGLRRQAGLHVNQILDLNCYSLPSFHIIGVEDKFKAQSEEFATLFANRKVMYIPGGHAISRQQRKDKVLRDKLLSFVRSNGDLVLSLPKPNFQPRSEVSNVALDPHFQVALVNRDNSKLPYGKADGSTILSMLEKWPADRPFLSESRVGNPAMSTTYGDVSNFIRGGKGDLRHLGVKSGDVVAYGAPVGGGAAAAMAFLSIAAQTTAAPLAPGTSFPDALDALDQFQASHLILFEGVKCPGVEEAFETYARTNKAKIHRATFNESDKPGIFSFESDIGVVGEPLANPEKGICLLLRTSGTTARPKGVPLKQDALINNGAIIAASMQLSETDVCYSVMPLFHIGGISASILCTLASGGSVCCDGEPFDPSRMVDALALSRPQPTWYSSVPTIHNATVTFIKDTASSDPKYKSYGIDANGVWKQGHSLRMIRSGAAALLGPDGSALAATYGGVPIYPTYSMSEQMPISQPPAGMGNTLTEKPESVGVPVAASMAIVRRNNLRPVEYGEEGEIAISGPTVLKRYLENADADRKSYFELTLDTSSDILGDITRGGRYFLTGDLGFLDSDGFLSLKGRAKEMIKKGGEQISPFEVEILLLEHPWIQTPVCFSVPSKLYGEEVGCALVLSTQAPSDKTEREIIASMRKWLKDAKLAPFKWPTHWAIRDDADLPKTKTKKYVRVGLSMVLGINAMEDIADITKTKELEKAKIDYACIGGLRFILAMYVMFMHIGSADSWGRMNNLRGFPWHVHVFFFLGGYSMASPMNPIIKKKFGYFKARMWAMYPMYIAAIIFGLANLLVVCRPSTFDPNFTYSSRPDDLERGFFCEGTPATPTSYWGSLVLTILTYAFGFMATPTFFLTWWLGYYLWFSSMYYQCLAFFPSMYNAFYDKARKKTKLILEIIIGLMLLNCAILVSFWYTARNAPAYGDDFDEAEKWNMGIISYYLFGPFWALYFVIGIATAFLYDAYRPSHKHNAWIWGWVADGCTLVIVGISIAHLVQGKSTYEMNPDLDFFMRPDEANQWTDTASVNRIWDATTARLFCPITTLWVFALSTGHGFSAMFFRQEFLSVTLAPHAYNCFLFHQIVLQWYYAATRPGSFWNWWQYRKSFYWFSPKPCPVEWYEYFYLVGLVVAFSSIMLRVEPIVASMLDWFASFVYKQEESEVEEETIKVLMDVIEGMTGIEPEPEYSLEECGLASIGVPVLVNLLNKNFSKGKDKGKVTVNAVDIVSAETIQEMADIIDEAKELADFQGI